jgi:hypothetical protein
MPLKHEKQKPDVLFLATPNEELLESDSNFDVDEIDAAGRELAKLVEIAAAVDDAGVDKRRGFGGRHFAQRKECRGWSQRVARRPTFVSPQPS